MTSPAFPLFIATTLFACTSSAYVTTDAALEDAQQQSDATTDLPDATPPDANPGQPLSWTALELEADSGTFNNILMELDDDDIPHLVYLAEAPTTGTNTDLSYAKITALGTIKERLPSIRDYRVGFTLHAGVPTLAIVERASGGAAGDVALYQRQPLAWEHTRTLVNADSSDTSLITDLLLKSDDDALHLIMRDYNIAGPADWRYTSSTINWRTELGVNSGHKHFDIEITDSPRVYTQIASIAKVFETVRTGTDEWDNRVVVELPSEAGYVNGIAVQADRDASGTHLVIHANNLGTDLPQQIHYAFRAADATSWAVSTVADVSTADGTAVFDLDIEVHDGVPHIFYSFTEQAPINPENSPGKLVYGVLRDGSWDLQDVMPDEAPIEADMAIDSQGKAHFAVQVYGRQTLYFRPD